MKSRLLMSFTAMTLFAVMAIPNGAVTRELRNKSPTHYSLTILNTLGGTYAEGNGLNTKASVTGWSTLTGDMVGDAFLWRKGTITDLGRFGGYLSVGTSVNDRDVVAGYSNTSIPDPNGEDVCGNGTNLICLPFVWQNGVMTALPLLGGNNGQGGSINSRGQIVGGSETPIQDSCSIFFLQVEAVIWAKGQVHELPPFPGDPDAFANVINDEGEVIGASGCVATNTIRAVLWPKGANGGVIDLGNLGGTGGNVPYAINNQGQVVGQSDVTGDTTHHAFLWQNGVMTDLGTLYGLAVSLADGINNKGQVVGFSQDANSNNTVASLWQDGVLTDLNTLIPPNSPMFLTEAIGINDRGQISGFGQIADGENQAFLLTPCNDGDKGCGADVAHSAVSPRAGAAPAIPHSTAVTHVAGYHENRVVLPKLYGGHCQATKQNGIWRLTHECVYKAVFGGKCSIFFDDIQCLNGELARNIVKTCGTHVDSSWPCS